MFVVVPIFIGVVFVLVMGMIIFVLAKSIAAWSHNNAQPILSEWARVVAKRSDTSSSFDSNIGGDFSTWYFATFEFPSGERREFLIAGQDYGLLCEGDEGSLTYQGTRFRGFIRGPG